MVLANKVKYLLGFGIVLLIMNTCESPIDGLNYKRENPAENFEITQISASRTVISATAKVETDGRSPITERGFIYKVNGIPTLEDNELKVQNGSGTGAFTSDLNAIAGQEFTVRAYAKNANGIFYSAEKKITTQAAVVPDLLVENPTAITQTSATFAATISDNGGRPILVKGFIWGTSATINLITNLGKTTNGTGTDSFSDAANGLSPETEYFVLAYATNSTAKAFTTLAEEDENPINTVGEPTWIKDGLVAWYPFNGNANDESGNGNNGTVNGATLSADRFGKSGKAYSFDGVNDYLKIDFSPTIIKSLTFWISLKEPNVNKYITSKSSGDGGTVINWQNNLIKARLGSPGGYFLSGYQPYLNQWYYIQITNDGIKQNFYVNGVLINETIGNNNEFEQSLYFMRHPTSGYEVDGSLDDIRIYNRALSDAEVKELYEYENTDMSWVNEGLVAYYPFTDGSLQDFSGNANNGTNNGATKTTDRHGIAGNAMSFDGVDDWIEIPDSPYLDFGIGEFTLTGWLRYPSQVGGSHNYSAILIKSRLINPWEGFTIFVDEPSSGNMEFRVTAASNNQLNTSGLQLNNNQWYQFVALRQGTSLKLWLNGELSLTKTVLQTNVTNDQPLWIGVNHLVRNSQNYKGSLDDIRIYNRALSDTEIQQLYTLEKPAN